MSGEPVIIFSDVAYQILSHIREMRNSNDPVERIMYSHRIGTDSIDLKQCYLQGRLDAFDTVICSLKETIDHA